MRTSTIEEINNEYMENFEKLEEKYNKFYNKSVDKIKLFLYILMKITRYIV